jgi:hypothetical protein
VTPRGFDAIGRRRGNGEWASVRVAICVRARTAGQCEWGLTNKILYLPWRVEAPRNVTASKRLFFYLFFVIWTALMSVLLRKGE